MKITTRQLLELDACDPGLQEFMALFPKGFRGEWTECMQALCMGEWLCPDGHSHSLRKWIMWGVSNHIISLWSMQGWDLRGANLSGSDLRGAYLSGANLSDAYLSDANLRGAYRTADPPAGWVIKDGRLCKEDL